MAQKKQGLQQYTLKFVQTMLINKNLTNRPELIIPHRLEICKNFGKHFGPKCLLVCTSFPVLVSLTKFLVSTVEIQQHAFENSFSLGFGMNLTCCCACFACTALMILLKLGLVTVSTAWHNTWPTVGSSGVVTVVAITLGLMKYCWA